MEPHFCALPQLPTAGSELSRQRRGDHVPQAGGASQVHLLQPPAPCREPLAATKVTGKDTREGAALRRFPSVSACSPRISLSELASPLVKWGWFDRPRKGGETRRVAPLCSRIYSICHYSTKLREVITHDLLPSSAMIRHLSQEFGLPISLEELTDEKSLASPPHPISTLDLRSRKSTLNMEILAHQEKYLQWRNSVMRKQRYQTRNLIQVGTLSALQSGVPGLAPPGLSGHILGAIGQVATSRMGHLPLACTCSAALGAQAGWARRAGCRAGPHRRTHSAWLAPSS